MAFYIRAPGRRAFLLASASPQGAPLAAKITPEPTGNAPSEIVFTGDTVLIGADAGATLCLLSSPGAVPAATFSLLANDDGPLLEIDGAAVKLKAANAKAVGATYEFTVRASNSDGHVDKSHVVTVVARVGLPDDTVLFERELIGTGAAAGTIHTFGQPFARGRVPADGKVRARIKGGADLDTQLDPQTWWEDGTVKYAVGAIKLPSLAADATETLEFVVGGNASPGSSLDWSTITSGRELKVTVQTIDETNTPTGSPWTFDVLDALAEPTRFRRSGPLVMEARVWSAIPSASFDGSTGGRVVVDVWITSDGTMYCVPVLENGYVDFPEATCTSARVRMTVTMDGGEADVRQGIIAQLSRHVQNQYQWKAGTAAAKYTAWMRIPVYETMMAGFGGYFKQDLGQDSSSLSSVRSTMSSSAWDAWTCWGDYKNKLRDVPQGNPTGGVWFLYGPPFTDRGGQFIIGGHQDFYRYEIEAGEALGISMMFQFDKSTDKWLNNYDRPGFRAHRNNPNYVPYVRTASGDTRTSDNAHRSCAPLMPTLYTGRRDLLDIVLGYVAYTTCSGPTEIDGTSHRRWFHTTDSQVRSQSYRMSYFNCALFCTPTDEPEVRLDWMAANLEANLNYWVNTFPTWNEGLGELAGAFPHTYGAATDVFRYSGWMQSLVNMALTDLARQGNATAETVLRYSMRFPNSGFARSGTNWPQQLTQQSVPYYDVNRGYITTWDDFIDFLNIARPDPGKYDKNYVRMFRASLCRLAWLYPDDEEIRSWVTGFFAPDGDDPQWSEAYSAGKLKVEGAKNAILLPPGYSVTDPTYGATPAV